MDTFGFPLWLMLNTKFSWSLPSLSQAVSCIQPMHVESELHQKLWMSPWR
jgi:hypothetical protein